MAQSGEDYWKPRRTLYRRRLAIPWTTQLPCCRSGVARFTFLARRSIRGWLAEEILRHIGNQNLELGADIQRSISSGVVQATGMVLGNKSGNGPMAQQAAISRSIPQMNKMRISAFLMKPQSFAGACHDLPYRQRIVNGPTIERALVLCGRDRR